MPGRFDGRDPEEYEYDEIEAEEAEPEEKPEERSIFRPDWRKPNFILSVMVNTVRVLAVLILLLGIAGIGALLGIAKGYVDTAPELDLAALDGQAQTSFIYDCNGNLITEYKGTENRVMVSLAAMPVNLRNAFVAVEDARFYAHQGVDLKRIVGAFVNNLTSSGTQGGSTITQQLIKNTLLSSEQSYKRKIQEAYLAMQLEQKYSKDEILESYLNTIYLGENYYGVQVAAEGYFGKSLGELTLRECAILAGVTNNPYHYNPRRNFYTRSSETTDYAAITNNRTDYVLRCMYENQFITYDQYQKALDPGTASVLATSPSDGDRMYPYAHYVEYAVNEVIDIFLERNGLENTAANRAQMESRLRTGGYHVKLALDPAIQETVQDTISNWSKYPSLRDPADKVFRSRNSDGTYTEIIQPQAACTVLDYRTGELKAIIGSRTEVTARKTLNRATDMKMPVGSSIKPIAVYAPALELGASPASVAYNMPLPIAGWKDAKGNDSWPTNYGGGGYVGPETLRAAMTKSHNTAAAYTLLSRVGVERSVDFLHRMGIDDGHIDATPFGLALWPFAGKQRHYPDADDGGIRRAGQQRNLSGADFRAGHIRLQRRRGLGRTPAPGPAKGFQRQHLLHDCGHAQERGFLRNGHLRQNQGADRWRKDGNQLRPEGRFLRRNDRILRFGAVDRARQLQGTLQQKHRQRRRRAAVAGLHGEAARKPAQPGHS